jgi:hypothetical protein
MLTVRNDSLNREFTECDQWRELMINRIVAGRVDRR